jgi:primosomal protein N' (replication factor Y)
MAPEVLIQTFSPGHEVLEAARAGDPAAVLAAERARRVLLGLPPFGALAVVSGPGSAAVVEQLRTPVEVGGDGNDRFVVRAPDWTTLGVALNSTERPSGSRVRIEVDPARL